MAGQRILNLHGLKFGTSPALGSPAQILAPTQASIRRGYRRIVSSADGVIARAAQAKGAWFCEATLNCEDVTSFVTQLAAWEAATAGLRAAQLEGLEHGAATVQTILLKRLALTRASLSIRKDGFASVSYGTRVSADSASNSQDDEITTTAGAVKTSTIGSGKRAYRIHTAQQGGTLDIPMVVGLDLNIEGEVQATSGDNDFGETIAVPQYDVSGKITIQDKTVSTALSLAERLCAMDPGAFTFKVRQQDGSTDTTFTLANSSFFDFSDTYQSNQFVNVDINFSLAAVSGTTIYGLASGSSKLLTAA